MTCAGLESNLSRLDHEVCVLREEIRQDESRYHQLHTSKQVSRGIGAHKNSFLQYLSAFYQKYEPRVLAMCTVYVDTVCLCGQCVDCCWSMC